MQTGACILPDRGTTCIVQGTVHALTLLRKSLPANCVDAADGVVECSCLCWTLMRVNGSFHWGSEHGLSHAASPVTMLCVCGEPCGLKDLGCGAVVSQVP